MQLGYDINILSKQSNIIEIVTASATDPEFMMRVSISLEKDFILIITLSVFFNKYFGDQLINFLSN